MSHTPGPWKIVRSPHGITIFEIGPCKPDEYAGAVWLSVSEADARLISAAPEMLEALQRIARSSDWGVTQIAKDAIAKATIS
ncbi:hypothetical protein [Pseudomonas paraeruginosa]|uniref:hypothetical protein n=1 Tax=Pseudomonas paraeruginosa TaxID=2994495 RepID=UPI001298670E|nr:hypothetical protein [Pseudomonas paraeruginosa]